jgi:agmatine deiminase
MQKFLLLPLSLLIIHSFISCRTEPTKDSNSQSTSSLRQPAEYEPQEAIWLIWSAFDHARGFSNEQVTLAIMDAVLPDTRVKVAVANDTLFSRAKSMIPAAWLESGQVELIKIPSMEFWARDMGPVFVVNGEGKLMVADFNFNTWGTMDSTEAHARVEEKFDERVAETMNLPIISSQMVSEGGDREVNGEGCLLVVESVELQRNPGMTKAQIEAEFAQLLGVTKAIWLKQGLREDDHPFRGRVTLKDGSKAYNSLVTNGHVDEFARFVNDSTILLAQVDSADLDDPVAQENHRRMEENFQILKNARDQNGKPFKIIRVPLPPLLLQTMRPGDVVYDALSGMDFQDGSKFPTGKSVQVIAAASYLNFLITNKTVIAPKYYQKGRSEVLKKRDAQVNKILQNVFPDRKIVMLDVMAVNLGGGGIHCITMQEPKIAGSGR